MVDFGYTGTQRPKYGAGWGQTGSIGVADSVTSGSANSMGATPPLGATPQTSAAVAPTPATPSPELPNTPQSPYMGKNPETSMLGGISGFGTAIAAPDTWAGTSWANYSGPGMGSVPRGWQNDQNWVQIINSARMAADASGGPVGSPEWNKAYNLALRGQSDTIRARLFEAVGPDKASQHAMDYTIPETMWMKDVASKVDPTAGGNMEPQINPINTESKQVFDAVGNRLLQPGYSQSYFEQNLSNPNLVPEDANIGEYYANARRQAQNGINSTMAAQGKYGSSMLGDLTMGANVNLGAQEAKDRADYLLRASAENRGVNQLGMTSALGADQQATNQMLSWGTLGSEASGAQNAATSTMLGAVRGAGQDVAGAEQFWDSFSLGQDYKLLDDTQKAKVGAYKAAYDAQILDYQSARQGMLDVMSMAGSKGTGGGKTEGATT
jgi:hypothetical protein